MQIGFTHLFYNEMHTNWELPDAIIRAKNRIRADSTSLRYFGQ